MIIEQKIEELKSAHKTIREAYPEISDVTYSLSNLDYEVLENWRSVYHPNSVSKEINSRIYLFIIQQDGFYLRLETVPVKITTTIQVENL